MDGSDSISPKDRLRQERIAHNWRQQDVADQVGTTVVTVTRWERGNQQPSAYFRVKLCALFGKSAEALGLVQGTLPIPTTPERETAGVILMRSSPAESPTLWTVPYRRNPYFTGRDELLHVLDLHLSAERVGELTTTCRAALTQPQAMKGLGGIGKTQIAVEYAYRAREQSQYTHTLWINAASKEAMMASFTALAEVLPEFAAKNETDQQKLVEAIKRWLEHCSEPWLLIFDNADDLSLIQESFPQQGKGSILLTTRAHAVGSLATSIDVEKMGFIEGTHLLLRRAQRLTQASDEEVNEAGNIVVALDHFPLALEQAGAYIEETECSFEHYLELYHTHRSDLLARRGAQSTHYPDSVATTWSLSFQKVEQANPAAAELLRLCAFLAPDYIPEELLMDGAPHWPPMLQQAAADSFAFDRMLEALLAFSLVKRLVGDHILSLHRLVQEVLKDMTSKEDQQRWAERAVRATNAVFPEQIEITTWPLCRRFLSQAQACSSLIQTYEITNAEAGSLIYRTAQYMQEHAFYEQAEPLYQQAIYITEQNVGPGHPDVATILNKLATLYYKQGRYEQAEVLYQRARYIWEQTFGPDHANVARVLSNLALLYYAQGKYTEAEPLYQCALTIETQEDKADHLSNTLNNLAGLYEMLGRYTDAEQCLLQALAIRERALGPEHPGTALILSNLAGHYSDQKEYVQAEPLLVRAIAIYEQQFGPDHPDMARSFNTLVEIYMMQGKYTQAEPFATRAISIREQKLGIQHPDTARSLTTLARLFEAQGFYVQAGTLYQRALNIDERALGFQHPETLAIRTRYISLLAALERKVDVEKNDNKKYPSGDQ